MLPLWKPAVQTLHWVYTVKEFTRTFTVQKREISRNKCVHLQTGVTLRC